MYAPADICQTIARGIGFRSTNIRTLFHDEGLRHNVGLFWIEGLESYLEYNLRILNAIYFYYHDHALLILMLPSQAAGGKAA